MNRTELIKISTFQERVWGRNGTPLTQNAIREQIKRGDLPGKQIGKLWFIDWIVYSASTGNSLVDSVLRRRA